MDYLVSNTGFISEHVGQMTFEKEHSEEVFNSRRKILFRIPPINDLNTASQQNR
jgi:hypothetical protein